MVSPSGLIGLNQNSLQNPLKPFPRSSTCLYSFQGKTQ